MHSISRFVVKKVTNFSIFIEFDQTQPLGVFSHPITNLDTRNLSEARVRVYTSIFPKRSTLSFDVEITYLGVFWSQKAGFVHKNVVVITWGLQVDFGKNANFSS